MSKTLFNLIFILIFSFIFFISLKSYIPIELAVEDDQILQRTMSKTGCKYMRKHFKNSWIKLKPTSASNSRVRSQYEKDPCHCVTKAQYHGCEKPRWEGL